jgi:hypothetical protein
MSVDSIKIRQHLIAGEDRSSLQLISREVKPLCLYIQRLRRQKMGRFNCIWCNVQGKAGRGSLSDCGIDLLG